MTASQSRESPQMHDTIAGCELPAGRVTLGQ
jgi:hypothetical protein